MKGTKVIWAKFDAYQLFDSSNLVQLDPLIVLPLNLVCPEHRGHGQGKVMFVIRRLVRTGTGIRGVQQLMF